MNYRRRLNEKAGIYCIELVCSDGAWIKIGQSYCIGTRMSSLQNGCPITYTRVFYAEIMNNELVDIAEHQAHVALADRAHYGEWFIGKADNETLDMIVARCLLLGIRIEWVEFSRKRFTGEQARSRAVDKLSRAIQSREAKRKNEVERIKAESKKPLTGIEQQQLYRPTLYLKK